MALNGGGSMGLGDSRVPSPALIVQSERKRATEAKFAYQTRASSCLLSRVYVDVKETLSERVLTHEDL